MTTPWRKVLRDFWQERTRTVFVVLAIGLGIAGFDAVLSSNSILTRALNEGYLATNPASATVRTDAIDDTLLRAIAADRDVGDVEARRIVSGRIQAGPAEWRSVMLFVVKDFRDIRVSTLTPQQGAWPPAAGEMLIERDALQVARARIGDTVTVETASGHERTLRITGSVHDVGQAQARMEGIVYAYITLETLAQLGEEPYLDQLKLLVRENRFDEKHIRRVAEDVKTIVERRGHPVRGVDVPRPGQHPHADIMGLLLLAMASFGLLVVLLSGVLVVNLLAALMASQSRQIGMMMAIGGSRWQIARIYFGQALLLGVAAILVALPIGTLGSRMLCRYLAVFLNFDVTNFAAPLWVYLLVAAVGLLVPLLAAAYPVIKGCGIPVREALADFGASQNAFGASAFDRALAGLGGTARPLLFAVRNSFRRRTRLTLTLVTLTAGGLFFMSGLNVRASMIHTLDRLFASKKFDLSVSLGTMYPLEKVERATRNTPGVLGAEGWIATEGAMASAGGIAPTGGRAGGARAQGDSALVGDRFAVIALPAGTDLLKLDVIEGRGLLFGETDGLVANAALVARQPEMQVGSPVALRIGPTQMSWRVVGIVREPFSPPVAYVPLACFDNRHAGEVNSIRLVLDKTDPASMDGVKASLDRNLRQEGIRALSSLSKADSRFGFDQHMLMIYVFLIIVSCILGGVGGLGLMTTMSLNVLERRREMGVLRAIGASPWVVWLIVVSEGGVIAVMSWALAALAAWPVSKALGTLMLMLMFRSGLAFSFEPSGVLIWLAVSIALGTGASLLPAWHASRGSVLEAIGYE
jgi:putative ABC transport system permease protein